MRCTYSVDFTAMILMLIISSILPACFASIVSTSTEQLPKTSSIVTFISISVPFISIPISTPPSIHPSSSDTTKSPISTVTSTGGVSATPTASSPLTNSSIMPLISAQSSPTPTSIDIASAPSTTEASADIGIGLTSSSNSGHPISASILPLGFSSQQSPNPSTSGGTTVLTSGTSVLTFTSTVTATNSSTPSHRSGISQQAMIALIAVAALIAVTFITAATWLYRRSQATKPSRLMPFTEKDLPRVSQEFPYPQARIPRQEKDAGRVISEDLRSESEGTLPPGYGQVFDSSDGDVPPIPYTVMQNRENKLIV